MSEHTPGPWRYEPEHGGSYAILANQGPIEVCPAHVHGLSDARLIAAAPELLAALEECHALMCADNPADGWADAIAAAEVAIAKARGEQP